MEFCKACIPSRNVLIRENYKPWFTSEIRYNIRLRDRLRKLFLKSGRIADRLSYKRQRNKVNNMKKYAKENYVNNIDNIISNRDTGNSSKTFWQIMGRFVGKNNASTNNSPSQEKADALNNIFISVSDIKEANIPLPNFNSRTEFVLSQIRVTESEVKNILNTLKVNKETGSDGISNRMLKYNSKSIAKPLSKRFIISLKQRIYPNLWICVMPLFKKGERSDVSNYRPMSLISFVGKSFERIVYKHIYNHITANSLLYKYQSGFLPDHSTVLHLIELIHHTCLALEN